MEPKHGFAKFFFRLSNNTLKKGKGSQDQANEQEGEREREKRKRKRTKRWKDMDLGRARQRVHRGTLALPEVLALSNCVPEEQINTPINDEERIRVRV